MLPRPSFARAGAFGLGLALAGLCSFPFASCSSGDTQVNPLPDGGGGSGGAGGSSSTATSSSTGMNVTWSMCDGCLETTCAAQEAACDGECLAIQACLETVCFNLSAIGAAADEGQCQTKCQGEHPDGTASHLALFQCAEGAKCSPPCTFYPQDYDLCRAYMTKGACKDADQACKDSSDCQTYKDCVSICKTIKECIACDDTPSGLAGRKVLEAYELCVAGECTAEAWLL
jgi:hypothetical protein